MIRLNRNASWKRQPQSKAAINPAANPSMIGNGKPGKMPFFSNAKKVMMEPAKMPTIAIIVGRMLCWETKEHNAHQHGVEHQVAQAPSEYP